jgi:pimeloyl-ACP methyl ester carboxylesterase
MEPTSGFARVNGLRLHYLEWGSKGKPPVLLVHGLAMYAYAWAPNAAVLASDFHVVAVDQRGHGDSDGGPCEDYTTDRLAADIVGVADALGWNKFFLVGQSMGAHTSIYTGARYPDRIARLVITDAEPVTRPLKGSHRGEERLAEYDSEEAFAQEMVLRDRWANIDRARDRARFALRQLPDGRLTVKYRLEAPNCWAPLDLWPQLPGISCPTLLVRGAESYVLREEDAAKMVHTIPNCQFVEIPRAGHSVGFDNPEDYNRALRSFFLSAAHPE